MNTSIFQLWCAPFCVSYRLRYLLISSPGRGSLPSTSKDQRHSWLSSVTPTRQLVFEDLLSERGPAKMWHSPRSKPWESSHATTAKGGWSWRHRQQPSNYIGLFQSMMMSQISQIKNESRAKKKKTTDMKPKSLPCHWTSHVKLSRRIWRFVPFLLEVDVEIYSAR